MVPIVLYFWSSCLVPKLLRTPPPPPSAPRIGSYEDLSVNVRGISCEFKDRFSRRSTQVSDARFITPASRKSGKWDKSVGAFVGRACPRGSLQEEEEEEEEKEKEEEMEGTTEKRRKVMNDRTISCGAGGSLTPWPGRHCSKMLQLPVATVDGPSLAAAGLGRVRFVRAGSARNGKSNAFHHLVKARRRTAGNRLYGVTFFLPLLLIWRR